MDTGYLNHSVVGQLVIDMTVGVQVEVGRKVELFEVGTIAVAIAGRLVAVERLEVIARFERKKECSGVA